MATDAGFIDYVCDQLRGAGGITAKKMFGEYGVYRYGKIVALACDNQFFVKPTPAGEEVLGTPTHGPPYPGAKPFFNVSDLLDDADLMVRLIVATDAALPAPKQKPAPKKKRAAAKKGVAGKVMAARKQTGPKKKSAVARKPPKRK